MTFSERLNEIAIALSSMSFDREAAPDEAVGNFALELSQLANELEQFDLEVREGQFPTPKQALTLGRLLNQAMRDERFAADPYNAGAHVSRSRMGVGGISENYLGVRFADGYEAGIDRDGRAST